MYKHLQFYHQWATALCNTAISIANIDSHKLACAHTQNRTLFKMLGFCRSGHIFQFHTMFNYKCEGIALNWNLSHTYPNTSRCDYNQLLWQLISLGKKIVKINVSGMLIVNCDWICKHPTFWIMFYFEY